MADAVDLKAVNTIDQVISTAREVIEPGLFAWATAGAGQEVTLNRNQIALNHLAFVPRVMKDVSVVDTSTTFLGVPMSLPVMLAPVGALALYHPNDATESAAGAAAFGTSAFCATLLAKARWSEVAETAPGRHFFQLYVLGDRDWLGKVVDKVEESPFAGLAITVDSPVVGRRDRSMAAGYNWSLERGEVPINLSALGADHGARKRFTWDDLEWVCGRTRLPVILKGVVSPDDARKAVDCGVAAIYVSNHGGRALDSSISTIEALGDVVDAVGDRAEVVVDSGFTRGGDVCKALALGAKAVGIGKLQCLALALGGAAGVAHVLEILRKEIDATMSNIGCTTVSQINRDHIRVSYPTIGAQNPFFATS
jgi:isopentenyl diphosphate isomerase/L-lactate dehydrogenase-like FMN-dependent dehydrogenase